MIEILFAAVFWVGTVDHVDAVEFNTYGSDQQTRTAIIYRDADGSIVDWRWFTTPDQIPRLINGRYVAVWNDEGKPRTVYCRIVYYVRSEIDREIAGRSDLPMDRRRKLAK